MSGSQSTFRPISLSSFMRCMGYSLVFLSNHMILRNPATLADSFGMRLYESLIVRMSLDIAFIIGLLGLGAYALLKHKNIPVKRLLVCQAVLLGVSCFVMLLCLDPSTRIPPEALLFTLFVSMGFFAAIGLEIWVWYLARANGAAAWLDIVFALLVSSFAYVFLIYASTVIPAAIVLTVVCALSLVCSAFYFPHSQSEERASVPDVIPEMITAPEQRHPQTSSQKSQSQRPHESEFIIENSSPASHDGQYREGSLKRVGFAVRDNISVLLCAIALGFALSASSMISIGETSNHAIILIFALGILFAAIVFLICIYTGRSSLDIRLIYQVAFPVLTFFFLLVPFMGDSFRYVFLLVTATAGTMGATSLFVVAFDSEKIYGVPSMGLLGIFLGCSHIFYLIGWAGNLEGSLGLMWYAASALLLIYIFVAIILLNRKKRQLHDTSPVVFIGSEKQLISAGSRIAEAFALSPREHEVLKLLLLGKNADEIAIELVISTNTVRTHTKNIYKKTGIHQRGELYELASRQA